MSLTVDGVWKAGAWATTVWADGVWREGAFVPTATTPVTGGIGKHRKYKQYPRKVMIHGRVYTVRSPEEERALLQAMLERAELARDYADAVNDEPAKQAAEKRIVRIKKGLYAAVDQRKLWLDRLIAEDEEILMVVLH